MLHTWHKYCYSVPSRVSMHSFLDSNCVYLKWTNVSCLCLSKKLANATPVRLTVPLLKKSDLKGHRITSIRKLFYSMQYSLETILYIEKSCSVALLFCNAPLTRLIHCSNMVGHSFKNTQYCFGTACSLIFQAWGKDPKLIFFTVIKPIPPT